MGFIKSHDTSVSVGNSRAEIEKVLRRYGASGISVQQTFDSLNRPEKVTVSFVVPNHVGSTQKVPVSLPVNVKQVYEALYGTRGRKITNFDAYKMAQAERVAWRNLVLWIDAALSAAAVGLQTITEAFYAHTVIQLENGGTARLADYLEASQGSLAPGIRALLASPAETA